MRKPLFILYLLCTLTAQAQTFHPDSILPRSILQNILKPQEKLYIHTDKPTYIAGEKVWLRVHVVEGSTHLPTVLSRYVYVELQNPFLETVTRIRLRADEEGHIYGHIPLSEELPTGEYTLTAYTRFMDNQGQDYFFRKRLYIANVLGKAIRMETRMDDTYLHVKFFNPVTGEQQDLQGCAAELPSGNINVQRSGKDFRIKIHDSKERMLLVQTGNYKEFVPIASRSDYDVTFHPEGGNLPSGALCRVAFKALNEQGQGENVTGTIRNEQDSIITSFKSIHRGMGVLTFIPQSGEKYRAVCENEAGSTKTFPLPLPEEQAFTLQVNRVKDKIYAKVIHNPAIIFADSLIVFTHQRGVPKHIGVWKQGAPFLPFEMEDFSSGTASFLLVSPQGKILSERMVFIHRNDLAKGTVTPDKPEYGTREKMTLDLLVTDAQGNPWNGNCSVAITDNADVQADSCVNILSTLLLTSDLKGHIEEPAWYFAEGNNVKRQQALDMLMMTQGWKKYDWQRVWQADYDSLAVFPEQSQVITGKVSRRMFNKPIEGAEVQMMSLSVGLSEKTRTDAEGNFRFEGFEFPDSTAYWLSAYTDRGKGNIVIDVDEETYPKLGNRLPPFGHTSKDISAAYLNKADYRMVMENGIRHIFLDDVLITAPKKVYKTEYERAPSAKTIKEKDIAQSGALTLEILIRQKYGYVPRGVYLLDGVMINPDKSETSQWALKNTLETLRPQDIEQIDYINALDAMGFYANVGSIVAITTKRGGEQYNAQWSVTNLKNIILLGYQEPTAFYSPRYDTASTKSKQIPDLRTTIYWQPSVVVKEGKVQVEFYTSDSPADYTLIMEGVGKNGTLLHVRRQICITQTLYGGNIE